MIVGGESGGKNARPMHPQWAREIRDAVLAEEQLRFDRAAHGPVAIECEHGYDVCPRCDGGRPSLHMKQWGSWRPGRGDAVGSSLTGDRRILREAILLDTEGKRRDTNELYTFTLPDDWAQMEYAGAAPTSGGKMLDGVDWCEHPPSPAAGAADPTRLFTPA